MSLADVPRRRKIVMFESLSPKRCGNCRFLFHGTAIDPKQDPEKQRPRANWCLLGLFIKEMDGQCPAGIRKDG